MVDRSDTSLLRLINVRKVVDAMFAAAPVAISRAELVRHTGLAKPTVSSMMADLESSGLVRLIDVGTPVGEMGRPPALYEIIPDSGFLLGADIGATKMIVGIADILGRVVYEQVASTMPTASDALDQVASIGRSLMRSVGDDTAQLAAACVAVPGIYRRGSDTVHGARNLPGFTGIQVAETLGRSLGVPVEVENDVNLAAVAEDWLNRGHDVTDFAAISIGTGLGMGLIIGDQLFRGGNGASGEIGSMRLPGGVCLEDVVSGPAICKAFGRAVESGSDSVLSSDAEVPAILDAAQHGDPVAERVVQHAADTLAEAIANVIMLFDPELIVLGGGIGANPAFSGRVRTALSALIADPPPVQSSTLGNRSTFLGAIGTAVRRFQSSIVTDRLMGWP